MDELPEPAPTDSDDGVFIFAANPHESQSWGGSTEKGEPVQTADGRWKTACVVEASPIRSVPDAIELRVWRYENGRKRSIGTATIELADTAEQPDDRKAPAWVFPGGRLSLSKKVTIRWPFSDIIETGDERC